MTAQAPADLTAANAGACIDCGRDDIGQPLTGRRRVLCSDCRIRRAARGRLRQAWALANEIGDDAAVSRIEAAIDQLTPPTHS